MLSNDTSLPMNYWSWLYYSMLSFLASCCSMFDSMSFMLFMVYAC